MTTPNDPLIGRLIDRRYLVAELIARGGMALVYRAEDTRLDRDVALKVMHAHLIVDEGFVARFRSEAKQAARLSHPHLVAVYDQGQDGDIVYLAMEYLPGITLREHLHARGALTPREAITILDAVLDGLSAAHEAGVMHRDVKPENVLLGGGGQVKLGDFGLARAVSASTSTNTLIGTVGYVSPELVVRGATDARSDVYAIGIMFYEMLTGEQPYRDEVAIQVAYRHVHDDVPAPSALVPGLAADLDELVLWATARDPENRPLNAAAMLGELRQVRATLSDAQLDADPLGAESVLPAASGRPGGDPAQRTRTLDRGALQRQVQGLGPAHEELSAPPEEPPPHDSSPAPRRRRRTGIAWIAALVVVLLLAGGTGWYFLRGPGSFITTPDGLTGSTLAVARKALEDAGLRAKEDQVFDGEAREGTIVSSNPASGQKVARGGTVTLRVSKGPEFFEMPKVTGKSFADAQKALTAGHFAVGTRKDRYDEEASAGTVVEQSVKAGDQAPRDTKVDLTVSKGPAPVPVPDLVGKTQAQAEKLAGDARLKLSVSTDFSDTVDKGTVISQDPGASAGGSATLHAGDTVKIVVSKGPQLVEVPSVVGQQQEQAEKTLKDAGFKVKTEKILGGYFGTVRQQDPAGGRKVPAGSTITITVV